MKSLERVMRDEPFVNFSTRLDIESAERRRRLEQQTGMKTRDLVAEALRRFEVEFSQDRESLK